MRYASIQIDFGIYGKRTAWKYPQHVGAFIRRHIQWNDRIVGFRITDPSGHVLVIERVS